MKKKHTWLRSVIFCVVEVVLIVAMIFVNARVGPPWSAIVSFLVLLTLGIYLFVINRRVDKEAEERFDLKIEEQNETTQYIGVLNEDYEHVPYLFLLHSASGSIYQLLHGQRQYHFIKVGGELSGIQEEKILKDFVSDSQIRDLETKHFSIDKAEITKFHFEPKHCVSTQLPNCGVITVTAPKKRNYIVLDEIPVEKVKTFFYDLQDRTVIDERKQRKQEDKKKRAHELGTWRIEHQKPETFQKLKMVRTVLAIISILASLNFLFFAWPDYELSAALCILIFAGTFVLLLIFPAYFSFIQTSRESIKNNRAKCINLMGQLLCPGFVLTLRCLYDFNFLSWQSALLVTIIFAAILTVFLVFATREIRGKIGNILSAFVLLLVVSFGIVGQLNYLLDFRPVFIEDGEIIDKYVSKGSKGPDEDIFIIRTEYGEELELSVYSDLYEALKIGDDVDILICQGAFGIPYADAYFDGELDDW